MKQRTRMLAVLLSAAVAVSMLTGCTGSGDNAGQKEQEKVQTETETENGEVQSDEVQETRTVTDVLGREVQVPAHPKSIAIAPIVLPSMVYALQGTGENFAAIGPGAYSGYEISVLKSLAPEIADVNTTAISDNGEVNMEALLNEKPDLVLGFTSMEGQVEQLEALNIPVVIMQSAKDLDSLKSLIAMLGDALNCRERADQLLAWYEETESYMDSKADQVAALTEDEKPRVLHFMYVEQMKIYGSGVNPYITELEGGSNIQLTGSSQETGVPTMEEILAYDPEIIFISNFDEVTPEDFYNNNLKGQDWSNVSAVKNHQVYKVPCGLYRWAPPNTIEKPLYMLWTASIVQPEIFHEVDIRSEVEDFFQEFFSYTLTEQELDQILHTDLNQNSGVQAE